MYLNMYTHTYIYMYTHKYICIYVYIVYTCTHTPYRYYGGPSMTYARGSSHSQTSQTFRIAQYQALLAASLPRRLNPPAKNI